MNVTKDYQIWDRKRPFLPAVGNIVSFVERRDRFLALDTVSGFQFSTSDGSIVRANDISEVSSMLEGNIMPHQWTLMGVAKSRDRNSADALHIHIDHHHTGALVSIGARDTDLINATFREIERTFGYGMLPKGIRTLRASPHATVMVGCHFDDPGIKAANRLARFLSLIGFARVDIANFSRSGTIQDKVTELIDRNSFYVGIVTGERDHAWISAESSYALAKDKDVILIQQQGIDFNPTLFGHDREHLTFKSSIDEAFISLLEEFRSRSVLGLM